jgi:hypothetical protein
MKQQYQECRQGGQTIQAYVDDFYRLSARNDLMETEDQQVARFIGGLRLAIQDKVSMHPIFTLNNVVSLATRADKQLEQPRAITWEGNPSDSTRVTQGQGKQSLVPKVTPSQLVTSTGKGASSSAYILRQPANNPYTRPDLDKCFKCNQPGHRSHQCPRRQMVNLIEPEPEEGFVHGDDIGCVRPVSSHIYESPNKKLIYEENVSYSEKVELPPEKQHVQPQPLVPTTVPVEEYPPQA